MRVRKLVLALAACSVASVLTACSTGVQGSEVGGSWEDITDAAAEEGQVTLYSSHAPDNLEALKAAFEAEYPDIRMEYIRGTDSEIIPRVDVEAETGVREADMVMVNDIGWVHRSIDAGDIATPLVGPSFSEPEYISETSVLGDQFFLASATIMGLAWNTEEFPDGFSDPEDVLDPELATRVGVVNPNGFPAVIDIYRKMDENYASDFVERLAELRPRIYPSSPAMTQAIASGEIVVAPAASMDVLVEKATGAPVDLFLPDDPIGVPWYAAALETGSNPNAAQLLADFIVTTSGQEALSANYVSVLPDIPGTGVAGSDVVAQDLALADPDQYSSGIDEFMSWWQDLFIR